MLILLSKRDCMIDVVYNNKSSEKIFHKPVKSRLRMNQRGSKTDHTRLLQNILCLIDSPSGNIRQRKERGTSIAVLFQKGDHCFGGLLIVRNDILDTSAKRCLNGDLVILLHTDNIGNNTDNARVMLLLLHDTAYTLSKALVPLCHVFQRI